MPKRDKTGRNGPTHESRLEAVALAPASGSTLGEAARGGRAGLTTV